MLVSQLPFKIIKPFASSASGSYITYPFPAPSQTGINPNNASLTDGFPPNTFVAGGYPRGQDFNGIMKEMSAWNWWQAAGGPVFYDSAFSTAVGGYPQGALLLAQSVQDSLWLSRHDNNTVNPDLSTTSTVDWILCLIGQPDLDARYTIKLQASDFYVSTTGNDTTGNGLSPGTAWATLAHAQAIISQYSAPGGVNIHVAAGTYTIPPGTNAFSVNRSQIGSWNVLGASASTTHIDATGSGCRGFVSFGDAIDVSSLSVNSYFEAFVASSGGSLTAHAVLAESTAPGAFPAFASYTNGSVQVYGQIGVTGSLSTVFGAQGGGIQIGYTDGVNPPLAINVTFTAANVSVATVTASDGGLVKFFPTVTTWTGAPVGAPGTYNFLASTCGGVDTTGQATNWIPGPAVGHATSPGYYA